MGLLPEIFVRGEYKDGVYYDSLAPKAETQAIPSMTVSPKNMPKQKPLEMSQRKPRKKK